MPVGWSSGWEPGKVFQVLSAGADPVDPGNSAHKLFFFLRFLFIDLSDFMHMRSLPGAPGYQRRVLHLLELETEWRSLREQVPLTDETSFHASAHKLLTPRTETSRALVLNLPNMVPL